MRTQCDEDVKRIINEYGMENLLNSIILNVSEFLNDVKFPYIEMLVEDIRKARDNYKARNKE